MIVFIIALCGCSVLAFPRFQNEIPSGGEVPHPCKVNYIWRGVGHLNPLGGGDRNPFGVDFNEAGNIWTTSLCRKDSDGDGKTNGEELGDPDCVWSKGTTPAVTVGISHPGVCTPFSDPACQAANSWVDCDIEKLQCDALNEDGMQNITVRFPETEVPSTATNYYCMLFELPSDDDYHMVATVPFIDNEEVMHHMILFGCDETNKEITDTPMNIPEPCGMGPHRQCLTMIGIWAVGFSGECVHKDIGFRMGQKGYRKAAMQVHWNNPLLRSDFTDSSGMTIYYTSNRRVHDATIMMIGQNYLAIPPGEASYTVESTCTQYCTSRLLSDTVYITRALNHMHYLGRQQRIEQYRGGVKLRDLTYDKLYSYDSPVLHEFENPIELRPGDELKTTCTYRSIGKDRTTLKGDGTSDEMCYGFLTFHPAENIQFPYCTAWKGLDICKFHYGQEVDGCTFRIFENETHPDTIRLAIDVFERCKAFGPCLGECKELINDNKCLHGDIADFYKQYANESREHMEFWAAVDSCKTEIALEAFQHDLSNCRNSTSVSKINAGVDEIAASLSVTCFSLLVSLSMRP
ncbi:tyramine beta-hydroxylase-like [Ylistrum balloti]|uniref:tyramine beta-hydroxylase-like n=1 Tax=Ylistrum balloti TaxID=509963 RepID=UPI0029058F73|nr:tyramine beta-hydroxylase-like [Ylistrum balloti]